MAIACCNEDMPRFSVLINLATRSFLSDKHYPIPPHQISPGHGKGGGGVALEEPGQRSQGKVPGARDGHVTWPQLCGCLELPNTAELKTGTSPCLLAWILPWGLAAKVTKSIYFSSGQVLRPHTQGSAERTLVGSPRAVEEGK